MVRLDDPAQGASASPPVPAGERNGGRTIAELLEADTVSERPHVLPTGFDPLDTVLEGGVRPGDLTIVGGAPGVGKTIATLQWARHVAANGGEVVYACYEHEEPALLARLLAAELGELAPQEFRTELAEIRLHLRRVAAGSASLAEILPTSLLLRTAVERTAPYRDRLRLVRASGADTGVQELEELLHEGTDALFVDYLQKVTAPGAEEIERVAFLARSLKDLAMSRSVALVAISACSHEGLTADRTRLHHLRGAAPIAFESDVVLLLNDKLKAVDQAHRDFDPVRARQFRNQVVFTVEKNRGGQTDLHVEFGSDFPSSRFDPSGRFTAERLADPS